MQNIIIVLITALHSLSLSAQTIPSSVSFNMYKTKVTMDRSTEEALPKRVCMQVFKRGNDITFFFCNTDKAERTYRITEVQKEVRGTEMYILQYFGYEYYNNDPVPSFLSYTYEYATGQWSVLLENVHDNPTVPLMRHLSIYFNP